MIQNNAPQTTYDTASIQDARIKMFQEKQIAENSSFKFEHVYDADKKQVFMQYTNPDPLLIRSSLCAALGSAGDAYTTIAIGQVLNAQFANEHNASAKANATIETLIGMEPKDVIEGQLCSRLVILFDQYNEHMRRAALHNQPLEVIERYTNIATKLMRMYNETLDTLNKYRRKGEQKFTVQHVNINGGQAVVTSQLNHTGGGDSQKG